jgi:pimeloyl-ACP methyl ester carboxylesterase
VFTKIQNLRIHYKIAGEGEPLILLHGWGSKIEHYEKLQNFLAQNFRVYAVDLPGFGLSTAPDDVWGTAEYAQFLQAFLANIKICNPIIIAHSFGGKIALYALAKNLFTAAKLILINSAGINLPKPWKTRYKIYSYKLLKKIGSLPGIKILLAAKIAAYQNKSGSLDYRDTRGIMRSILVKVINEDLRALIPAVNAPTTLIWGEEDTSTPLEAGKLMQKLLPHAELIVLQKCGHFPFVDNFEEVSRELEKALQ